MKKIVKQINQINYIQLSIIFLFVIIAFIISINFQDSSILKPLFAVIFISTIFIILLLKQDIIFLYNPFVICIGVFLLWNIFSLFFTPYIHQGFSRISFLFIGFLLFISIVSLQQKWNTDIFIKGLIWIALIQAIYGIIQRLGVSPFQWDYITRSHHIRRFGSLSNFRVSGTFGHPNYLASFLAFVIPAHFYLLTQRKKFWVILSLISLPLNLICLVFTLSRGGWIAGVVGTLLAGIFLIKKTKIDRKLLVYIIGGILILLIILSFLMPDIFLNRIKSLFNIQSAIDPGRINIWEGTWSMFQEKPVLGWGTGTFSKIFPRFRPSDYKLYAEDIALHAHNEYLEVLSETGIVGLLLFVLVLILFTKNVLKRRNNLAIWVLFSGMVGIFIQNLVSVTLRTPVIHLLFWAVLGISISGVSYPPKKYFEFRSLPKWILLIISLPILVYMIIFHTQNASSDYHLGKGIIHYTKAEVYDSPDKTRKWEYHLKIAEKQFKQAIKNNSQNEKALYKLGVVYMDKGKYTLSKKIFERLLSVAPYHPEARKNLGLSYYNIGKIDEAIENLQTSRKYITDSDTYFALGALYEKAAVFDSTMKYYEMFIPIGAKEWKRIKNLNAYPGFRQEQLHKLSGQFRQVYEKLEENYELYDLWKRAITPYEKAVEYVPEEAFFHYHLAIAYKKNRNFEKSIEQFDITLDLAGRKREYKHIILNALLKLSECYINIGEEKLAKNSLEELISLDEKNPLAEQAREMLETLND